VIVTEVVFEYSAQVVVIDHDQMIQALATNASDHPFRVAILPEFLQRNPKQSIAIAQLWPVFLTGEDSQLLTECDVFQGN